MQQQGAGAVPRAAPEEAPGGEGGSRPGGHGSVGGAEPASDDGASDGELVKPQIAASSRLSFSSVLRETEAGGEGGELHLQTEGGAPEAAGESTLREPVEAEKSRRNTPQACVYVCVSGGGGRPALGERQSEGGRVGSRGGNETQCSGGVRVP